MPVGQSVGSFDGGGVGVIGVGLGGAPAAPPTTAVGSAEAINGMLSSDQEATEETAEALGLVGGQRTSPEALQQGMQDAIERVRGSQAQEGEEAAGDQASLWRQRSWR